jgi:Peptidase family M48
MSSPGRGCGGRTFCAGGTTGVRGQKYRRVFVAFMLTLGAGRGCDCRIDLDINLDKEPSPLMLRHALRRTHGTLFQGAALCSRAMRLEPSPLLCALAALALALGCNHPESPPAQSPSYGQAYPPGQYPSGSPGRAPGQTMPGQAPGAYGPSPYAQPLPSAPYGQGAPGANPYGQPAPSAPPYGQGVPSAAPSAPPAAPSSPATTQAPTFPWPFPSLPSLPGSLPNPVDPINTVDLNWLRNEANNTLSALIAALPTAARGRVDNIPFYADPTVGEVNAYAACDDQGLPLMAITDGLLQIEAYTAQFRATDEIFGTQKLDGYLRLVAQYQRPKQPIVTPPAGFIDPAQNADARKVARQHQLMAEQIAFVLGHELAHHYLGHTGCANGTAKRSGVSAGDVGRLLARVVPAFNQPNEIAADVSGTQNLLTAGSKRADYRWNEEGALLTLDFFARLDQLTPASILFGFASTHPHPLVRRPIVQQTANNWRQSGGAGFQLPGLPNIFGP